jgi:hypothetical protein
LGKPGFVKVGLNQKTKKAWNFFQAFLSS